MNHKILVFFATLLFSLILNGADTPAFYTFKGRKVLLEPSGKYVAVKLKTENGALAEALSKLSGPLAAITPLNIRVLKASSDLEAAIEKSQKEIAKAFPVYRVGNLEVALQGEVIVRFKTNVPQDRIDKILQAQGGSFVASADAERKYLLTVPPKASALDVANKLADDKDNVQYAEPNFLVILPASTVRNPKSVVMPASSMPDLADPLFPQQWALENRGSPGKAGADIHIGGAWAVNTGISTVTIAILDDGVDTHHPDLTTKIVSPFETIDMEPHADPNPWDGHGTACARYGAAIKKRGGHLGCRGKCYDHARFRLPAATRKMDCGRRRPTLSPKGFGSHV